eukprot:CAMPEP_0204207292 /NCGR_PEP_ID=MMETSP0361-20130328/71662_1 /ASSEMBLY_ACC=CAM_ASM_000343 /TAXON_ID=268821 /ORGANISM="Scrippsiella Hangoei, Strain SHTV-5" /LENGTH=191 /DNA_ID=CAMNT_0051170863 /DNA_START=60 /DNA_END=632 /DNA_ORIENTATION=+
MRHSARLIARRLQCLPGSQLSHDLSHSGGMGLRHGNRSTRHQQVVKLQLQSHGGEKAHELAEDRDARHTRRVRDVHLHPPAAITKLIITTSPYHSVQLVKKPIPHAMVGRLPALPHRLQHLQQPRIQSRRQATVEVKATRLDQQRLVPQHPLARQPSGYDLRRDTASVAGRRQHLDRPRPPGDPLGQRSLP